MAWADYISDEKLPLGKKLHIAMAPVYHLDDYHFSQAIIHSSNDTTYTITVSRTLPGSIRYQNPPSDALRRLVDSLIQNSEGKICSIDPQGRDILIHLNCSEEEAQSLFESFREPGLFTGRVGTAVTATTGRQ